VKRIVWLASFPKSGNTWMRLLLANYFSASEVDLNELALGASAAGRQLFDQWSTVESSELTEEEIAECRGELFRPIAAHARSPVVLKSDRAWACSRAGSARSHGPSGVAPPAHRPARPAGRTWSPLRRATS